MATAIISVAFETVRLALFGSVKSDFLALSWLHEDTLQILLVTVSGKLKISMMYLPLYLFQLVISQLKISNNAVMYGGEVDMQNCCEVKRDFEGGSQLTRLCLGGRTPRPQTLRPFR